MDELVCKWLGTILLTRGTGGTIGKLLININKDLADRKQHDSAEFLMCLFNSLEECLKSRTCKEAVKNLRELFAVKKEIASACQICQTKKEPNQESNFLLLLR